MSAATNLTPDDDTLEPTEENVGAAKATSNLFDKTETALVLLEVHENPVVVFSKPESLDALYASLEREVDEFVPDLSTPTARQKITALAYKITRSKTAIDKAGKDLNAAKRAEIGLIDKARSSAWDRLEALAQRAKQPLIDWENAEKHRKEQIERDLEELRNAGMIFNDDTLDDLEARLAKLESMVIDDGSFGTFATEADGRRKSAIIALQNGIERIKKAEAEASELEASRAELARLREAQAERERQDAARAEADRLRQAEEARIAREKTDKEAREKAEREREAREAEQRERDRIEAEERMKAAAEAAERRAREEAAAEQQRREREIEDRHAAELKRIADEAAQKERDRLADLERERIAREAEEERRQDEARKAREAEEKRQADKKHRAKVKSEVAASIVQAVKTETLLASPVDGELIRQIVEAIADGRIAHTAIHF